MQSLFFELSCKDTKNNIIFYRKGKKLKQVKPN